MEEQNNTFTDASDDDKIGVNKEQSTNFLESTILSFVLIIGLAIIICDGFNAVTSIIYIMPCLVSSAARIARCSFKEPMCKLHIGAAILSLMAVVLMVICAYQDNTNVAVNCILVVYPVYEIAYTVMQKYVADKEVTK